MYNLVTLTNLLSSEIYRRRQPKLVFSRLATLLLRGIKVENKNCFYCVARRDLVHGKAEDFSQSNDTLGANNNNSILTVGLKISVM